MPHVLSAQSLEPQLRPFAAFQNPIILSAQSIKLAQILARIVCERLRNRRVIKNLLTKRLKIDALSESYEIVMKRTIKLILDYNALNYCV